MNTLINRDLTYTEAKALLNEFGRFTISSWTHYDMLVIDSDSGEYAIGTDNDADDAWEQSLDRYLEECVYPELHETMVNYFDDESWKRDARYDGRGHSLSSYNGDEIEFSKCDLYAFRLN